MSKIMLVTGGSRGLGAAIAELAAHRGYDVCISFRSDADRASSVAATVRAAGRRASIVQADVGNDADVIRMFEHVDRELGTPAVLVNNAGIAGRRGRVDSLDGSTLR